MRNVCYKILRKIKTKGDTLSLDVDPRRSKESRFGRGGKHFAEGVIRRRKTFVRG